MFRVDISHDRYKYDRVPTFIHSISRGLLRCHSFDLYQRSIKQTICCTKSNTLNEYRKCTMGVWHVLWRKSKGGGWSCFRWGDTGALRLSGEISWKKAQKVQGSWDGTSWAEAPSCIHSLGQPAQFRPVAQSCPSPCNPMDCSTTGFPVHYQLPKFTQTHVHWVRDDIQPSHPLPSPSPPAFKLFPASGSFPRSQFFA